MYVTLKLDDNGCCRIHSVSDDGNGWIVTNERYMVMPWKMVTRHGKNMTLKEVVDGILSQKESEAKERKIRLEKREEIENTHKEYYKAHMKEETERLNKLVDWYEFKLKRELQCENKLISYERAFKMLENNMYIAGIGQAILELLNFKVESGNHQRDSLYFRNVRTFSVI